MRVLVCGGRDFADTALLNKVLDLMHAASPFSALIQGGQRGADTLARDWARTKPDIKRFVSKADWVKHGRAAGPIRNSRMLEWKPDIVVAFPGGIGTSDMLNKAKEAEITTVHFLK